MEYLDGSHATEQGGCCCHRPQFDAASIVYSYSQDTDAKHSRLLGRIEHMVPVSSVHSSENQQWNQQSSFSSGFYLCRMQFRTVQGAKCTAGGRRCCLGLPTIHGVWLGFCVRALRML